MKYFDRMPAEKSAIKYSKPLMEKRRRQRINASLMQLKTLVLDALDKNNPRHSKLEKADILEMTVRYMRMVRRQQISASVNADPSKLGQYHSGYAECVNEVTRYLDATSTTNGSPELRTQLVRHLANPCTESHQQQQQKSQIQGTPPPLSQHQQQTTNSHHHQQHSEPALICVSTESRATIDSNSNNVTTPFLEGAQPNYAMATEVYNTEQDRHLYQHSHSDTAIKSLPSGEIAVILPQQTLSNGQLPTHFIPVYAQGSAVMSPNKDDVTHQTISPSHLYRSCTPSSISMSPCSSPLMVNLSPNQSLQPNTEPFAFEHIELHDVKSEFIAPISNDCMPKKVSMWRPW